MNVSWGQSTDLNAMVVPMVGAASMFMRWYVPLSLVIPNPGHFWKLLQIKLKCISQILKNVQTEARFLKMKTAWDSCRAQKLPQAIAQPTKELASVTFEMLVNLVLGRALDE